MNPSDNQASTELGLFARAAGIVFSPSATFIQVVRSPRPAAILFLICLVVGLAAALPQFTEKGRQSTLEMQVQTIEQFTGQPVTPEMYAQMEARARYSPYQTFGGVFLALPVASIFFTALYWALFNVILGGTATFKQVLGVVTHAQVIGALGAALAAPIQMLQGVQSIYGPFTLGALVPMLEPDSVIVSFLSALTFFSLWEVVVTGIGLAVLYRRSQSAMILGVLALSLAMTAARVFGFSFLASSLSQR